MNASELSVLEAEARYHGERFALYRARRYGSRPTSEARFTGLERAAKLAAGRLAAARAVDNRPSR
jgi:hypothetical protein